MPSPTSRLTTRRGCGALAAVGAQHSHHADVAAPYRRGQPSVVGTSAFETETELLAAELDRSQSISFSHPDRSAPNDRLSSRPPIALSATARRTYLWGCRYRQQLGAGEGHSSRGVQRGGAPVEIGRQLVRRCCHSHHAPNRSITRSTVTDSPWCRRCGTSRRTGTSDPLSSTARMTSLPLTQLSSAA